ncbi:MAG: hypothetical protein ACI9S8_001739 [Chlamydiales bacterium]|jgi:hypothetical protein
MVNRGDPNVSVGPSFPDGSKEEPIGKGSKLIGRKVSQKEGLKRSTLSRIFKVFKEEIFSGCISTEKLLEDNSYSKGVEGQFPPGFFLDMKGLEDTRSTASSTPISSDGPSSISSKDSSPISSPQVSLHGEDSILELETGELKPEHAYSLLISAQKNASTNCFDLTQKNDSIRGNFLESGQKLAEVAHYVQTNEGHESMLASLGNIESAVIEDRDASIDELSMKFKAIGSPSKAEVQRFQKDVQTVRCRANALIRQPKLLSQFKDFQVFHIWLHSCDVGLRANVLSEGVDLQNKPIPGLEIGATNLDDLLMAVGVDHDAAMGYMLVDHETGKNVFAESHADLLTKLEEKTELGEAKYSFARSRQKGMKDNESEGMSLIQHRKSMVAHTRDIRTILSGLADKLCPKLTLQESGVVKGLTFDAFAATVPGEFLDCFGSPTMRLNTVRNGADGLFTSTLSSDTPDPALSLKVPEGTPKRQGQRARIDSLKAEIEEKGIDVAVKRLPGRVVGFADLGALVSEGSEDWVRGESSGVFSEEFFGRFGKDATVLLDYAAKVKEWAKGGYEVIPGREEVKALHSWAHFHSSQESFAEGRILLAEDNLLGMIAMEEYLTGMSSDARPDGWEESHRQNALDMVSKIRSGYQKQYCVGNDNQPLVDKEIGKWKIRDSAASSVKTYAKELLDLLPEELRTKPNPRGGVTFDSCLSEMSGGDVNSMLVLNSSELNELFLKYDSTVSSRADMSPFAMARQNAGWQDFALSNYTATHSS